MKKLYAITLLTTTALWELVCWGASPLCAQTQDSLLKGKIFELSPQDVLRLAQKKKDIDNQITTVSQRGETQFEVPLAASVLTREMIRNAGVLSIPEALRLLPGVIVRETTAGNYDVHIRGFNSLPPATDFVNSYENMTLVMVNSRPIFNYFSGGTFWETLPIDLNDVERIELIRGPASALYGPNAVNGVVNIITRQVSQNGAYSVVNTSAGSGNILNTNATLGYRVNDKLSLMASSNLTNRNRTQDTYFDLSSRQYVNTPAGIASYQTGQRLSQERITQAYGDFGDALTRWGVNGMVSYKPMDKILFDISIGAQESEAKYPFNETTYTPISWNISKTYYGDLRSRFFDGNLNFSYLSGTQQLGATFLGSHYDFNQFNFLADYEFKIKNFYLKPAVNFQSAIYNDLPYITVAGAGIINARQHISNLGLSLRADYSFKNLRIIAAVRSDAFNVPRDRYLNYQLALTYKPAEKHLFRAAIGQATRSIFIVDAFANYNDGITPISPTLQLSARIGNNQKIKLPQVRNIEIGYRYQSGSKWSLEAELFASRGNNFIFSTQSQSIDPAPPIPTLKVVFAPQNLDLVANAYGATWSADYNTQRTQLRVFATFQITNLQNFSPYTLTPSSDPSGNANTSIQTNLSNYKALPNWSAGVYYHHQFNNQWSLNLNSYLMGDYTLYHRTDRPTAPGQSLGNGHTTPAKVLLNTKLQYSPARQISIFVNLRNILFQDAVEYYYTDRIGTYFIGGMHFEL